MGERVVKGDREDLSSAIEQLVHDTAMLEPTDLSRLGILLNRIDSISGRINEMGLVGIATVTGGLKVLIEKLILGEIPDRGFAVQAIGIGVSLIKTLEKNDGQWPEGIDPWTASIASLIASLGVLPESFESTGEELPALAPSEAKPESLTDRELCQDFVTEALEHLGNIEIHLINLEQNPEDRDCVNSIFRPFHSIKGVSGFLNLQQIHQFAHEIETLLDRMRSSQLRAPPEFVDLVLSAVDQMKAMILDLKNSLHTGSPLTYWNLAPPLKKIRTLRKRLRSDISGEPEPIGQILVQKGEVTRHDVTAALEKQEKHSEEKKLGEILIGEGRTTAKHVLQALREQRTQIPTPDPVRDRHDSVKVGTEKLAWLVNMIGDLMIVQSMIRRNPRVATIRDQKLRKDLAHLGRAAAELQKAVMSLRMVRVGQTFQRMVPLVRDLYRKSGKSLELRMEGEDTEIDRNMAEALYDPVVHMIRNAVDHGIETPEARKRAGKPDSGCIILKAFLSDGTIGIEVQDDGRGLDRDRILHRAVEKGLVSAADTLTESQINNLIFHPGLSTSKKVSYVSGRGVGMDVVKKAVERLHGKVEIESRPGRGSIFRLLLPHTLAIIDGLIVRVGRQRYVVPAVSVMDSIRPKRDTSFTVHERGKVVQVGENPLPLVRLHEVLDVRSERVDPCEAALLVIENDRRKFCLMVDDLVDKHEVVVKSLGARWKGLRGIAGKTILGDGKVGLILDMNAIFSAGRKKAGADGRLKSGAWSMTRRKRKKGG